MLRLLQEREFRAVGSLTTRKVEIRVIADTHRNLIREIEHESFRQDLFYRLNVVTVRLPPLRERREDIPFSWALSGASGSQAFAGQRKQWKH